MKQQGLVICTALALALVASSRTYAHCEIPCGIYNDQMRVVQMLEHITTIEKSMNQITASFEKDDMTPLDVQQLVRWISNKEDHADQLQHIVTQYFMTQRVKLPADGDAAAAKKYIAQLGPLHGILVHAMKAKQTVDLAHVEKLRALVQQFAEAYLSPEAVAHLKEHH